MNKKTFLRLLGPALLIATAGAFAQAPAADNTKTNHHDQSSGSLTADQQKNDASDVDIAARIRKSVMADKSLSTYGHNVKIISVNGMVTLKGPVHNDAEKTSIAAEAAKVVGVDHVTNQLSIAPK